MVNLGDGETECILLSNKNSSFIIATDDGTARKSIIKLLGISRLTGSLALLRETYRNTIINCDEVKIYYSIMIIKGGFLPAVDEKILCS